MLFISPFTGPVHGEPVVVNHPRCEYVVNPLGIDVTAPRLSWELVSTERGAKQIAYEVRVASTADQLSRDQADLWDSGKVVSDQQNQVEYAGLPLKSRMDAYWKVRCWSDSGEPSAWSETGHWSMGLLRPDDWKAQWISDATLADPANWPLTPIHCYRSELAVRPDTQKWIVVDLGSSQNIDMINLAPARPAKLNGDYRTLMFPVRFKIEISDDPNFLTPKVVVDKTAEDFEAPRSSKCPFKFAIVAGRYVRLTVTKLARWDGRAYVFALGGLSVNAGGNLVSGDAHATSSDSVESPDYSISYIGRDQQAVELAPDSKSLAVDFPGVQAKHTVSRVPMLRREFTIDAAIKRATLYVSARGFDEFHINGNRVGDDLLDPGYSDYSKRIAYQTFDVTNLLHQGPNAMAALLGYGWYAGHMNLFDLRCIDGFYPLLFAQIEVELVDGRRLTLGTDEKWRTTLSGAIRWSDLLDGEGYDSRLETPGWDKPGFGDQDWKAAYSQPADEVPLVWPRCQPVRAIQEIHPVAMKEVKPGVYVYDLGQEISGFCRLKVDGPADTKIAIRHAEIIGSDGMIDVRNLWGVAAEDDYLLDGKGPHVFEPHFTYHGFRYVEVTGLPTPPTPDTLVAISIHTDVATTGDFTCSNDLYNRIMTAVRWTQWNMLFDVPAGCAGRAERVAWLGDIRPCVQTAMFNMDTAAFFSKYTTDIRDAQTADGRYCDITPHSFLRGTNVCVGAPGWADAGISLPWEEYVNFGDRRILEEHFDSAKRWVDFVRGANPNLLWQKARGNDWGDWLSAGKPTTPKDVGATAFFAHSADLVSRMAQALGRQEEAARYQDLFQGIRRAFLKNYVDATGMIGGSHNGANPDDAQGSYALALQFGLLDEPVRSLAAQHLHDLVTKEGYHPTTGFWSSGELLLSLSKSGYNEDAAAMLDQRTKPSWGYMVDTSTTLWESFDATKRNLSLNHWTHSAVGEWLWRNVAGISPDPLNPGYRSIIIRPQPSKEVSSCEATYRSILGPISVKWGEKGEEFTLDLVIPVGATADIYLPTSNPMAVQEGGKLASEVEGVKLLQKDKASLAYRVGSGIYHFLVNGT